VIVDDYGAASGCKAAVDDFRVAHAIAGEMSFVDETQITCVWWRHS
jgi:hypothetical protein